METIAEELMQAGIDLEHIIYIDMDKRGYISIKTADQTEAVTEPYEKTDRLKYLFIDEIQNVEGFE